MDTGPSHRLALALLTLDQTLEQISRLVALGRDAVEQDPFLPLAAEQLGIRLGHNYHEIDFDILWDAYAVAVPRMRAGLAAEIESAHATMAESEPPADEEPAPRA